jgi:predicted RNA-binding Zn-ribbon protein involved in translation (DUF1610 family)
MPLTGPVPEGEKFFCPNCGALYSVTRRQASNKETNNKETNLSKCVVCLQAMDQSELTAVSLFKLIHRPEDA